MRVHSPTVGAVALGAALALTAATAWAADMPMAPSLDAPASDRVVLGTSWYLRGDLGMAKDKPLPIDGVGTPSSRSFPNTWTLGLGFGYKFNNWLRTDMTFDWRQPETAQGWSWIAQGCAMSPTPCTGFASNRITSMQVLGNIYADLGEWWGLTPYIGVGVGMSTLEQRMNVVPGNGSWRYAPSYQTVNFAWAAMAGLSYAITPTFTTDVGYRYVNMGRVQTLSALGFPWKNSYDSHEVRVGFRYYPDF